MKGDHRSFARAAATSLLGLIIQVVLGLSLLFYSMVGGVVNGIAMQGDHAAQTAAYHILITSAVWLMLMIVFDQHRRERLEAMEAESLDATAARESSVFGTMSDDLRVNAKRLAWMYKVVVPAVSIAVGVALIAMGAWKYHEVTRNLSGALAEASNAATHGNWFEEYTGIPYQGWAISLGMGVAVVGFVFARFTSGMSKNPVWAPLRAGSSAAVAASLFGLALSLGQFAEVLGAVRASRYLLVAFPIASMVLGAEVLVNFLLNLYRPRKPGEMPRPAVDSWLLGSVAAPDQIAKNIGGAIGYQFGVDVSGSWAYRLVSRSLGTLILFAAGVVWLLTCVTIVGPDEQGVRVRLGKRIASEDSRDASVGPGIHFTLPWPIERIERTATTHLHTVDLATARPPESLRHVLWTNDHKIKDELKVIVRSSRAAQALPAPVGAAVPALLAPEAPASVDQSLSLLVVEVPLVYRINDLKKYEELATPQTRDAYIKALARREVVRYLGTLDEDELLSTRRVETSDKIRKLVGDALTAANTGVETVFCGIEGVHPPKDTASSYEGVVQSQLFANVAVERANLEATNTLIGAAGSQQAATELAKELDAMDRLQQSKAPAEQIKAQEARVEAMVRAAGGAVGSSLATARADRWSKHMSQRGAAESYAGRLAAFHANPDLYFATTYLETISDIMKDSRLYIIDDRYPTSRIQLDLKDLNTAGFEGFKPGDNK
jgi:regulator of protease activity HflC (stomatin/prohibitin superfamily)